MNDYYDDDREDYPAPLPPRRYRDAGHNAEAYARGIGQSRDLLTQSGQTVALAQEAPLTEGFVYTATFDVIPPTDADGNLIPFSAEATLRFSENGNTVVRVISIVQGTSISLPGRVIDVRVTDVTPEFLPLSEGAPTPGAGSKYTVIVVIERATRGGGQQAAAPILYGGIYQISSAATQAVGIPAGVGAKSVMIAWAPSATGETLKELLVNFTAAGGAGVFMTFEVDTDFEGLFVPIPPGATEITMTNTSGPGNPGNAALFFGIDG
jgi:hypothetical protein